MRDELNVKAGDKVIVHARFSKYIAEVEKITPTGRIRVKGTYYDKHGHQIGGDIWSRSLITIATEEDIERLNQERTILDTIRRMNNFRGNLRYEDAVKIDDILKKY